MHEEGSAAGIAPGQCAFRRLQLRGRGAVACTDAGEGPAGGCGAMSVRSGYSSGDQRVGSVMSRMRLEGTLWRVWWMPEGQSIEISRAEAAGPRPKWTRGSLEEA